MSSMSNISSGHEVGSFSTNISSNGASSLPPPPAAKKKRNLPGTPDPNADIIALSPTTLMATNRFVCEICNKGFQRDQNLQLHRRGHNLPWKLKQRAPGVEVRKRVYLCPEPSCVHHNPARALGDLTGIKKHFSRKHGEKKWKCERCSKKYAVQSDWKAHSKTCGTREYKCDCGTIFSRRDSFITHRAFCDALTDENSKSQGGLGATALIGQNPFLSATELKCFDHKNNNLNDNNMMFSSAKPLNGGIGTGSMFSSSIGSLLGSLTNGNGSSAMSRFDGMSANCNGRNQALSTNPSIGLMSATALLQKAAQMGATTSQGMNSPQTETNYGTKMASSSSSSMAREVIQQLTSSFNPNQSPMNGRSSMEDTNPIGAGLLDNHHHQQQQQHEISSEFEEEHNNPLLSNMGMFNRLLFDNNGSLFMKNMENNGPNGQESAGLFEVNRETTTTVDFLGLGGIAPTEGGHGEMMQLKGIGHHRVVGLNNQFHQPQVSSLDKAMWEG